MKNRMLLIVSLAGGLMLAAGAAFGQDPSAEARTPEMVEGQVTNVDKDQGKLTIRANDGTMHEFKASKALEGYKVGDPIKAKLRTVP